jgi:poly(3-hydroxybutyrate) depolymerase
MTEKRHGAAVQQEPGTDNIPIGEFDGAATLPGDSSALMSTPMYWLYEMGQAALNPSRALADATKLFFKNPANPFTHTTYGKSIAAAAELFERSTRRYHRPEWGIDSVTVGAEPIPVHTVNVWERPFCRLLHFERAFARPPRRPQPKLLIVAPMSGHYPTLLRGTVETFLPNHEVYVTEWADARMVPVAEGRFDLDDYIDYLISMLQALGGDVHVVAVCQPSVPVMAAISLMEADKDPCVPHSMVLMGGPIDTRINSNAVNKMAESRSIDWFRSHVITKVPFPHPGFMRDVYPGFLQLHGFMSMNLDRHLEAHRNLFRHLVKGDGDSAQKHREFYDEYLAVMDLSAEFYLQTVDTVFIRHALPKGEMTHRGRRIDPSQIKRVALLTVEGEHDDISGVGQTEAAHVLCSNIPADKKAHYLQPAVGHYGVFNGSRFRAEIAPRIADFVLTHNGARRSGSGAHPGPAKAASASR